MAHRLSQDLPGDRRRHQPRPRPARRRRRPHPASRARQTDAVERRLLQLRAPAARATDAARQGAEEAGGAAQASAGVRRPLPRQRHQGDAGPVAPEDAGQDGADRGGGRRNRPAVQMAADRQAPQPADRRDGESERRLRRPRRAFQARSDARQRRPHRPARRQRQRQVDLRQADRRAPRADERQDGARRQARGRLLRPAPDRRPRRPTARPTATSPSGCAARRRPRSAAARR